jgi:hypothetical protein
MTYSGAELTGFFGMTDEAATAKPAPAGRPSRHWLPFTIRC